LRKHLQELDSSSPGPDSMINGPCLREPTAVGDGCGCPAPVGKPAAAVVGSVPRFYRKVMWTDVDRVVAWGVGGAHVKADAKCSLRNAAWPTR
jgi:hypothetical protein